MIKGKKKALTKRGKSRIKQPPRDGLSLFILVGFLRLIHLKVSAAFIVIHAFPIIFVYRKPWYFNCFFPLGRTDSSFQVCGAYENINACSEQSIRFWKMLLLRYRRILRHRWFDGKNPKFDCFSRRKGLYGGTYGQSLCNGTASAYTEASFLLSVVRKHGVHSGNPFRKYGAVRPYAIAAQAALMPMRWLRGNS